MLCTIFIFNFFFLIVFYDRSNGSEPKENEIGLFDARTDSSDFYNQSTEGSSKSYSSYIELLVCTFITQSTLCFVYILRTS